MAGLISQVERMKNDPSTSKEGALKMQNKVNEYKHKLKLANQVIQKFSQGMGLQNVPEREAAEVLGPLASDKQQREIDRLRRRQEEIQG